MQVHLGHKSIPVSMSDIQCVKNNTKYMPRLTAEQSEWALGMIHMEATHTHVARTFDGSRVAVAYLM